MLPYILPSKSTLPYSLGMVSTTGFGCNDDIKAYALFHEHNLNLIGAKFLATTAKSLFNPMKRKAVEEKQLDLYVPHNKKLSEEVGDEKQRFETQIDAKATIRTTLIIGLRCTTSRA